MVVFILVEVLLQQMIPSPATMAVLRSLVREADQMSRGLGEEDREVIFTLPSPMARRRMEISEEAGEGADMELELYFLIRVVMGDLGEVVVEVFMEMVVTGDMEEAEEV